MYSDDELLPISGLQHLAFCPRQCALIHLERKWEENYLTASGRVMHDRVHSGPSESRGSIRTVRGLMLRSRLLGLAGIADVVEFHQIEQDQVDTVRSESIRQTDLGITKTEPENDMEQNSCSLYANKSCEKVQWPHAVRLPKKRGLWRPYPVEYKRGSPKHNNCDAVQLCAQAICLEEMLHCSIIEGSLYYGQTRHREIVVFNSSLRQETERLTRDFHELIKSCQTPLPVAQSRCKACSLADECFPDIKPLMVMKYLRKNWEEAEIS